MVGTLGVLSYQVETLSDTVTVPPPVSGADIDSLYHLLDVAHFRLRELAVLLDDLASAVARLPQSSVRRSPTQ